jgi:hypothetical protein
MSAVWELFSFSDWPTYSRKTTTKKFSRADDQERGAGNCKVAEEVWKSASYIGPGGPLMRDR